jgi:hypothetical protein
VVSSDASASQDRFKSDVSDSQPDWLQSLCPRCGEVLVSACRYVDGRGYLLKLACVGVDCDYDRTL